MEIINHSGRQLPAMPQRVVSLVPSLTELLFDLGLEERVVGITKFCVHPAIWHQTKKKVGGTKKVHIADVRALKPDLIIANREENVQAQVAELAEFCPVLVTDVDTYAEALRTITGIGRYTGTEAKADMLVQHITEAFDAWQPPGPRFNSCYIIWQDPFMVAGGQTFIGDMLRLAGFQNVFEAVERYPSVGIMEINEADPEIILLSSEPYPFSKKHLAGWETNVPTATPLLVDGEIFSWYGSRMLRAPQYFRQLWQRLTPQ